MWKCDKKTFVAVQLAARMVTSKPPCTPLVVASIQIRIGLLWYKPVSTGQYDYGVGWSHLGADAQSRSTSRAQRSCHTTAQRKSYTILVESLHFCNYKIAFWGQQIMMLDTRNNTESTDGFLQYSTNCTVLQYKYMTTMGEFEFRRVSVSLLRLEFSPLAGRVAVQYCSTSTSTGRVTSPPVVVVCSTTVYGIWDSRFQVPTQFSFQSISSAMKS